MCCVIIKIYFFNRKKTAFNSLQKSKGGKPLNFFMDIFGLINSHLVPLDKRLCGSQLNIKKYSQIYYFFEFIFWGDLRGLTLMGIKK